MSIAFLIPSTSRGRDWKTFRETYLCQFLSSSFERTKSEAFQYTFYFGFDVTDELYSTEDFLRELSVAFPSNKVVRFEGVEKGHLTKMWNILFLEAYNDGCDYFIQCGDDVEFIQEGWIDDCVSVLSQNGGVGVAGPIDVNNTRLLTQTMVSRKHMEIFGFYFPEEIKNWYCDDWINKMYKAVNKFFAIPKICINRGGKERYDIEHGGGVILKKIINKYIEKIKI